MILFLDYDGVLHPQTPRQNLSDADNRLFSYLPRLEAVLRDFPQYRIVVSSSWREGRPWENVISAFSGDISQRIIGSTPVLQRKEPPYPKHPRFDEIELYLAAKGQQRVRWLALDDEARLFPPDCPNLLLCADGFRQAEEDALRARFKEQFRKNVARSGHRTLALELVDDFVPPWRPALGLAS